MTQELPRRDVDSEPRFCEVCNCALRVEETTDDDLVVRCACGHSRAVVPIRDLPRGWDV